MTEYELFKLFAAAAILGGLMYWIFVVPRRAQRARRKALAPAAQCDQKWDPRIWAGPRNRNR